MKIAILMDAILRPSIISQSIIDKLGQLGEVVMNETNGTDDETIKKLLKNADIAITSWGNTTMTPELLDCAPNLKFIAHAAGSVKSIVSDEVYERNILVSSCARVLSYGVSETALGYTITAAKNFYNLNAGISRGKWIDDYSTVTELFDITIGVVSCGFAGSHYIELLQSFDVDVIAYDPYKSESEILSLGARKVELDELIKTSHIISLHAPSIDSTHHMINDKTLSMMRSDAILINTARGSLIDEGALYQHMKNGKLKYACLDVTDPEPPLADNPLRTLENCIMTPHIAGQANNGKQKIGVHVYKEIMKMLEGEPLQDSITKEMLSTIA